MDRFLKSVDHFWFLWTAFWNLWTTFVITFWTSLTSNDSHIDVAALLCFNDMPNCSLFSSKGKGKMRKRGSSNAISGGKSANS